MGREIKIRGKRLETGEWVYGYVIKYLTGKCYIYEPVMSSVSENDMYEYDVIPETVGQYTGLLDKNGKEVYEGDIVAHASGCSIRYIVEWHNAGFVEKQIGSSSYAGISYRIDTTEVIGNIHDNPELLKQ